VPLSFATNGVMQGRYRLVDRIGAGGMASVWRARDEVLHRDVALKVFSTAATTSETIAAQEREARTAAGLTHHGLVTLLDAGVDEDEEHGNRIFLVMELIEGQDLKRHLESARLSMRDIAYIGHDIAEALEYLHHHDVVHRDIKPANILLSDFRGGGTRPRAKLTDFGIALPSDLELPNEGTTTGTAAYLSPEQANLDLVGPPSDIYSLGLVLLECFTHEVAFPGDQVESAIGRLVRDPNIPAELDEEWRALLAAMTARNPEDRPSTRDTMVALRDLVISNLGRRRTVPDAAQLLDDGEPAPFTGASPLDARIRMYRQRVSTGDGEIAEVQYVEETDRHLIVRVRFATRDLRSIYTARPQLITRSGDSLPWVSSSENGGALDRVADIVFARVGSLVAVDKLVLAGVETDRIEVELHSAHTA